MTVERVPPYESMEDIHLELKVIELKIPSKTLLSKISIENIREKASPDYNYFYRSSSFWFSKINSNNIIHILHMK